VEIVKNKSFTKSAEKLMVSQPMLTRVVKKLEEELDTQLIERSSKIFHVTDAGMMLNEKALELLDKHEDLYRFIDDIKDTKTGQVRLSIPGVILDTYFPELLRSFYALHPHIEISIIEEGSKLTTKSVLENDVDLGMVMLPIGKHPSIVTEKVWESVCKWVAPNTHPLAGKETVHLKELKDEPFITFSDTATLHDFFIANCEKEGFTPRILYKSLMPNFVFDMVAFGLCTAIMPDPIINKYKKPDIVSAPIKPELPWDIAIIYNQERYQSYATKKLLEFIIDYFKAMAAA
jgi:DNA-binding transcriptional LysR family regulator